MKIKDIVASVAIAVLVVGLFFVVVEYSGRAPQSPYQTQTAGSFSPTGGGTYTLRSSIGTTDTSITLNSFDEPVSGIPYTMSYLGSTIEYGTLAPQTNYSEFISFTGITQNADGSATLTGVNRGLSRTPGTGGCVASSTLAQPHAGETAFIISNSPCFYSQYVVAQNANSITGVFTFASTSPPQYDLDPGAAAFTAAASSTLIDQAQLNRAILSGCSNANFILNGCVQLATPRQAASSTVTGSTGAKDVLASSYATDTPGEATSSVIMSLMNGKLAQGWFDLTQAFTITGEWIFNGGGVLDTASSTFTSNMQIAANASNKLTLNGISYSFPSTQGANGTVFINNGSGQLSSGFPNPSVVYQNPYVNVGSASESTTTVYTLAVPANTISNFVRLTTFWSETSQNCYEEIGFGTGSATTAIAYLNSTNGGGVLGLQSMISASMDATSTSAEFIYSNGTQGSQPVPPSFNTFATTNLSAQTYFEFDVRSPAGSATCYLTGYTFETL